MHLGTDKYTTVSVAVPDAPIQIGMLQQFLRAALPDGLVRMKGVLWVDDVVGGEGGGRAEGNAAAAGADGGSSTKIPLNHGSPGASGLRKVRSIVHMSGRGRLGFELDGSWSGPPSTMVAFIGPALDGAAIAAAFKALAAPPAPTSVPDMQTRYWRAVEQIKETELFEHVHALSGKASPGAVLFRLTGHGLFGYTAAEIERDLRIDLDACNIELADAVNASIDRPKAFLSFVRGDAGIALCHGVDGSITPNLPETEQIGGNWDVVIREATRIIKYAFRNVSSCKCGV